MRASDFAATACQIILRTTHKACFHSCGPDWSAIILSTPGDIADAVDSMHYRQYRASCNVQLTVPSPDKKTVTSEKRSEKIGLHDADLPILQIHVSKPFLVFVRVSYYNVPWPDSPI